jgi:2-dehydro-3-deoxyphosphogluconate aldolase/(4S)-4-hydroxy-2-oxoglutarate aldolase
MTNILEDVVSRRLIPVAMIEDPAAAGPLADALVAGGLPCAEITLRSPAALQALAAMARRGDVLVGAGTVLTAGQARQALDAGARFLVAPGLDPALVAFCREAKVPVLPGVCTPTEIQTALGLGLDTVKFFPAEAFGGVATLRALGAVFPMVRFVPTGGIAAANLAAYLALPQVAACGGSWIVDRGLIVQGRFDEIRRRVAASMHIVHQDGELAP